MKLILLKIGKAVNVLKENGFFYGGKVLIISGWRFIRAIIGVGSGDILFVTGGVGDSVLYRVYHHREELELHGFRCFDTVQDNPFLLSYAGKFKIFIFHRTVYTRRIKKFIEEIKKQKKSIVFDTDDLIFDPQYIKAMEYFINASEAEKEAFKEGIGAQIVKDPYVKVCTTATAYLAKILEGYGKKVFIVPNKLSNNDLRIVKEIEKNKSQLSRLPMPGTGGQANLNSQVSIGYFSGTKSHDRDFAVMSEVLIGLMNKYKNLELFAAGPLEIDKKFNAFGERIKHPPYVPRKEHFENISKVDINIAPLEAGNPFNESKSELKFFEAGVFGIPTVASATGTFKRAISNGVDGFIASAPEEWKDSLRKLIEDKNFRIDIGKKSKDKVLKNFTNKNSRNEEYYDYLREKL